MNWVEYVRRDTEGSDSDTRRRAASELVRALCERFPEQARPPGAAGGSATAPQPLPCSLPCSLQGS